MNRVNSRTGSAMMTAVKHCPRHLLLYHSPIVPAQSHVKAVAILTEADLSSNLSFVVNVIAVVLAYFHYGCVLRCVARDIETPIVFLFLSPRNATQRKAQP